MSAPTSLDDRPHTSAPAPVRVRRAPHPLRAELLRGLPPWAGLGLAVTLGAYLYNTSETWQGSWTDTMGMLRAGGVMLGGPLALAAGCWQGGRERRRGTDVLRAASARGPLAQFLVAALPLACWLTVAYALAFAGGTLASRPYATPGGFVPTAFVSTAAALAACSLIGHVVGALARWRLAAPLLGVAGYGLFGVAATTRNALRFLGPVPEGFTSDQLLVWWHPFLTAWWVLALAAAAALAHTARRRWTALVPLAAAVVAATLLLQVGDGMSRPDPRAHRQVCTTDTVPQICVNGTRARQLPAVTAAMRPLTDRLKGVRNLPTRFEDLPGRPAADEAELPMLYPLGWHLVRGRITDPEQYRWEAAAGLIDGYDCPVRDIPAEVALVDQAVQRWLGPSHISDIIRKQHLKSARANNDKAALRRLKAEQRAYDHLRTMSPADRHTWLSRYFEDQERCGRTDSEVPQL
ncbi:hypothetical protein GTY65_17125 [Streptomyces sp. SID8379]|uniref:US12 family protein n=1 Tax=unclassified Streptomyces TaxID=2593676 RepID=UPI00035ED825|nr:MULTISPECIES: US12 family protein [unclassified Streptomyces]MYW65763.1 hypothetical protein [Streptomyces sp. SID8379]